MSQSPRVVVSVVVGAALGLLAVFGVLAAAEPTANQGKAAEFNYGVTG